MREQHIGHGGVSGGAGVGSDVQGGGLSNRLRPTTAAHQWVPKAHRRARVLRHPSATWARLTSRLSSVACILRHPGARDCCSGTHGGPGGDCAPLTPRAHVLRLRARRLPASLADRDQLRAPSQRPAPFSVVRELRLEGSRQPLSPWFRPAQRGAGLRCSFVAQKPRRATGARLRRRRRQRGAACCPPHDLPPCPLLRRLGDSAH